MILYIFIALLIFVLLIGISLFVFISLKRKNLGIPDGKIMYTDTKETPGEVLYAKTISLIGKPDYIINKNNVITPVEVKTGKTPDKPYPNHIAQLFVYCFLVKEHYGITPTHGFIRYPQESFRIDYEESFENNIKEVVNKLLLNKKNKQNYRKFDKSKLCFDCGKNCNK